VFIATALLRLILAAFAIRGARWAYAAFVAVSLAYFPMKMGFALRPRACEVAFDAQMAGVALTKMAHVILFAVFFIFSSSQAGRDASPRRVLLVAGAATLVMGALVELAEGVTGAGNCRLRDLLPDAVGVAIGAAILLAWHAVFRTKSLNPFAPLQPRNAG
jgi:hypothetical protein